MAYDIGNTLQRIKLLREIIQREPRIFVGIKPHSEKRSRIE